VDEHEPGASVEGVFNLAGNVYEWVADAYGRYDAAPDGDPLDNPVRLPTALDDPGVARGSCFFTEPEHTVSERSVFYLDFDWG
jgi:formylglycine-generating enzyme required for sulfatase activity